MIKVDRRTELITTAQQLFYTKGYESTSVNDIINATGASKGSFYHHFDSKQAVMMSVVEGLVEQSQQMIQPILDNPEINALEKFRQIVSTVNDWKVEQKEQMLAILKVLYSDENLRLRDQLMAENKRMALPIWAKILEQGVAEGVFDLGGIKESHAAEFIITLLRDAGESFAHLRVNPNRPADSATMMIEKYASVEQAINRILGVSVDSLRLVDPDDISAWFD